MAISPNNFTGGLQLPLQPSRSGGLRLLSGDEYITQLIQSLVADDESDNPFLEIGLTIGTIFANLSDGGWRAQQQKRIKDLFLELERAQIAKLKSATFGDTAGNEPGTHQVTILYYSIETDTEQQVITTVRRI